MIGKPARYFPRTLMYHQSPDGSTGAGSCMQYCSKIGLLLATTYIPYRWTMAAATTNMWNIWWLWNWQNIKTWLSVVTLIHLWSYCNGNMKMQILLWQLWLSGLLHYTRWANKNCGILILFISVQITDQFLRVKAATAFSVS